MVIGTIAATATPTTSAATLTPSHGRRCGIEASLRSASHTGQTGLIQEILTFISLISVAHEDRRVKRNLIDLEPHAVATVLKCLLLRGQCICPDAALRREAVRSLSHRHLLIRGGANRCRFITPQTVRANAPVPMVVPASNLSRYHAPQQREHIMATLRRESIKAAASGLVLTGALAAMIVIGSRKLDHFDAALVGYTFATLFAAFGITYRYSMWLQRPPTRMYWRRGWRLFLSPSSLGRNLRHLARRFFTEFVLNRFIFRRNKWRWSAHWLIMWGCLLAAAVTFPLVWGWIHFQTVPDHLDWYRVYVFGLPTISFPVDSPIAFFTFHGLVWASWLVIAGVILAFRRRMIDHGAAAVQQFGEDILPLLLLFAVSVTGLMLTASYTWMKGYAFDFLAILHAITVIFTLLWLPFGKFFHIFQRPAQLGASFYKDVNQAPATPKTRCARCRNEYMSVMWRDDLIAVQRELGFQYEMMNSEKSHEGPAQSHHYQDVCPKCRRSLFGLAQSALWSAPHHASESGT